jgi:hypothetical protein
LRSTCARSSSPRSAGRCRRPLWSSIISISSNLASQTLTEVRHRVTVQVRGRRGRKGNREWELRNRLTRKAAGMRGEHVDALLDQLSNLPKRSPNRSPPRGTPRRTCLTCSHWLVPTPTANRSVTCCTGSTNAAPMPVCPSWRAWPPRSRPGGRRSSRSCAPGLPTPVRKEPTESSRPSPATRTASATPSTSDYEPEPRPPAKPAATSTPADSQKHPAFGAAGAPRTSATPNPRNSQDPWIVCQAPW